MNIVQIIFNLLRFDRANWKAVLLCILAAMVFWIFNAFNKEYSTNLRFPILFEFNGERYVPAEHFPKSVTLNVSGIGWDLFRRRIGVKVPQVIIPLDRPAEIKKIVASALIPVIATQIGNLKINFVVTDTLRIQIDKRDAHRYKLKGDISGVTFREGYGRISPVVVLPDSVRLEGPESRLHAIIDSILLSVDGKNVSENFRGEVEVTFAGSEFVKRDPPVAQVMFEVGQVRLLTKKLKVVLDSPEANTVQDSVSARFQVPLSRIMDFSLQSREMISAVNANYLKTHKSARPNVLNLPSYAQLISVDSVYIKAN